MRKYLIIALLLSTTSLLADHVDPQTARKVATTFLNNNGAKATQLTDLSKSAGFQNLYIFTTEQGFVVMSADDCVQPILGYSFDGHFTTADMPDNVRSWLQGYSDAIQSAIDNQVKTTSETTKQWKDLIDGNSNAAKSTTVIAPLIQTKWNQNKYYNDLCPAATDGPNGHAFTGCVATAMAQIMKYWNYPSKGIGSHSYTWHGQNLSADFGTTNYDWENMGLYYEYYYPNPTGNASGLDNSYHTPEKVAAVATLMYHCGVSINMDYGGDGSSASTSAVVNALKTYFNYSSDISYKEKKDFEDHWIEMLKNELDDKRPLQYRGSTGGGGGHSFVCDGYDNQDYFHFNWGWAGSLDGYFTLNNLNTGANSQAGAGNGDYTNDQAAIFGIKPSNNNSIPSNLTYSMQGLQSLTLNWDAANSISSYNVYRNGILVGNTTATTYSENAPLGTNTYWVRSVDTNDELSLSSNSVSVTIAYQTPIVDNLEASLTGNNVNLSWTEPDWCYPETESAILNYGTGDVYYSWTAVYYAHRHLAENLIDYVGKAVYKVSTYIQYPGDYSLFVYSKSISNNQPDPESLEANFNQIPLALSNEWYEFVLPNPIILTETDDLWIVMKQENTGQQYPTPSFNLSSHNPNAFYAGSSPTSLNDANSSYNCAWLINTYLTDGTYTYNLYDGSTPIASAIEGTSYLVESLTNNTSHQFTVKTNYYRGESDASNSVGITLGSAVIGTLDMDDNDQMTVTQGSTLIVENLTNDHPENLVIEDGGQLIHSSTGVKATVKQSIAAYTNGNNDGWRLVCVPVADGATPSDANGWLNGSNYDLYYYDEPTHYWKNIKSTGSVFDIDYTKGYLYANSDGTQLQSAGTLQPSVEDYTIKNLSYTNTLTSLRGFNLVGNPFVCNATVNKDFYVMNPAGTEVELAASDRLVVPCEGIFVVATESDRTVTFSRATAKNSTGNCIDLVLARNGIELDRARVRFGDDDNLEKFNMNESSTRLYFPDADKDFAVVYTHPESELPLNFQTDSEGSYSLSVAIDGVELTYLHLIDHLTGADIDLLTTPNYAFDARAKDYDSRFQLRFTERNTNENNIPSDFIEGDLQILDVTGRVVGADPQMKLTPGVYVIRSINSNDIKTEKIIIK